MSTNTSIALTNTYDYYNNNKLNFVWLDLPATDEEIENAIKQLNISEITEGDGFFISDFSTDLNIEGDFFQACNMGQINEINDIMAQIDALNEYELEEFNAILQYTGSNYFQEAWKIFEDHDYCYYGDVSNLYDLGEMGVENGYIEVPDNLVNFIDYEAVGRDIDFSNSGGFTRDGYIEIYA